MQEHIYKPQKARIIKQSFLIWFFVAFHIAANIMLIPTLLDRGEFLGLIFINLLLAGISIPAIILFFKHYNYSSGKRFIVTYNHLRLVDDKTGQIIEIENSNIKSINLVENHTSSRLPWCFL